ncbi:MAG: hypothetical protein OXH69_10655 [Acidobacteria bacterium]|nr:hypothetical protein [Acidobacteriota bacterium]
MRDQLTRAVLDYQGKTLDQLERDVPGDDKEIAEQLRARRDELGRLARSQALVRETPVALYVATAEAEEAASADDKPLLEFLEGQGIENRGGLNGEQRFTAAIVRQSLDRFGPAEPAPRALLARELWRRAERARELLHIWRSDHLPAVHANDWNGFPNAWTVEADGGHPLADEASDFSPEATRAEVPPTEARRHRRGVLAMALVVVMLLLVAFALGGLVQPFGRPGEVQRDWYGPSTVRITEPVDGDVKQRGSSFSVRGSYLAGGAFRDVWIFVFPHASCGGEAPGPWALHCPGWVQSPRMEDGLPARKNRLQRTFDVEVWLGGEDLQNLRYDVVAFLGDEAAAGMMTSYMTEPSAATAEGDRQESAARRGLRYDQLPPTFVEMDRITVLRSD